MKRIPTSFALGGWLGFLGVTGLSELSQALGVTSFGGVALESAAGTGASSALVGMLCLGAAGLLAASLVNLHSDEEARVRRGEVFGFAAIGICSAMVCAALVFGAPFASVFDRLDLAFWSVGLSLVALAFDACIFAPDAHDEPDEMAFRRTVAAIDASIPRHRQPVRRTARREGEEF